MLNLKKRFVDLNNTVYYIWKRYTFYLLYLLTKILTIVMKLEISNKLDVLIDRRLLWINVTSG